MVRDGVWRTSTRSGSEGDCVEVAGFAETVGVRDSKDRQGPALTFTESAWSDFVVATRARQFTTRR
ncbi:DUF397 domain-containing protein [Micromonospora sp. ALFpr18c]|uniref:DUF397 domain-containing protein n=1 Tax=unclassified Micromonospora TaxID=2617518 RepID=UPI00124BC49A|nr:MULTISPECIES: DUF397 domain-containing protein [unclassified Micromonospora]KAB1947873.1 DUF397 domain-containing protein [Micromonospora sp. ALFpr18c]MDG4759541.1 DUF397 domain-containing protein [Micromonospora sp. WMMD710]